MESRLEKFKSFILLVQSGKEKHVYVYKKVINIVEKIAVIFLSIGLIVLAVVTPDLKIKTRIIAFIFGFFMLFYEINITKIISNVKRKKDRRDVSNCSGKNSSIRSKE